MVLSDSSILRIECEQCFSIAVSVIKKMKMDTACRDDLAGLVKMISNVERVELDLKTILQRRQGRLTPTKGQKRYEGC